MRMVSQDEMEKMDLLDQLPTTELTLSLDIVKQVIFLTVHTD